MKTRMHRFWLSITLAASSFALPLSDQLWSHDLPTRRSPDAISSAHADSSWHYLLDDCLGGRELATADGRDNSDCNDFDMRSSTLPGGPDFDAILSRNSLARFTSDLACWANQWEQLQAKAGRAARADLLSRTLAAKNLVAARPANGFPPAPPARHVDTCGFEAEYQAAIAANEKAASVEMQSAAAPASAIDQAELARSLAAAAEIEAAAIDSLVVAAEATNEESNRCGGEQNEIVSVNEQFSRFAPQIVDEYMSYDVDPRDAHWLGGLGKSWKLNSALVAPLSQGHDADESANADTPTAELAAEDFATADALPRPAAESLPAAPAIDDTLKNYVCDAIDWLDNAHCLLAAELCAMDRASELGEQWGQLALGAAQRSISSYVAVGNYLELPPSVANPGLDLVVVYTDSEGIETEVPSSLARAWNRPESDDSLDVADPFAADPYAAEPYAADPYDAAVGELANDASNDEVGSDAALRQLLPGVNVAQLRREILSIVAAKLDSIGITCLETADHLSNWAQTQIASRDDGDVR